MSWRASLRLWREAVDLCEQLNRLCRYQPSQQGNAVKAILRQA